MPSTCVKYFFIIICSFYIFFKLLNLPIQFKKIYISILIALFAQLPLYYIRAQFPFMLTPSCILLLGAYAFVVHKITPRVIVVTSIISYGLSYISTILPSILIAPITVVLQKSLSNHEFATCVSYTIIGVFQLFISSIPFRFKRLKNGMPFILEKTSNIVGVTVCITILLIAFLLTTFEAHDIVLAFSLILLAICGILLIFWWLRQITQNYMNKLRTREIDELKTEITKLKEDNERLAKIIHKDNKLIPAMEIAVRDLLETGTHTNCDEVFQAKASELLSELELLASERKGILTTYESVGSQFPLTGQTRVDSLLGYMRQKAANYQINFLFTLNCNLKYMIKNIIAEDLLTTLIADLVENSMIATKDQSVKNILLSICVENSSYCLSISDSGHSFSPEVISNLGQIATTTHKNTGGSGIGLMTICEILRQHKGSLHIEEFTNNPDYTKKLTLSFDDRKRIVVHSKRPEIICLSVARQDIIFTD